jgi:hypothetical protein
MATVLTAFTKVVVMPLTVISVKEASVRVMDTVPKLSLA